MLYNNPFDAITSASSSAATGPGREYQDNELESLQSVLRWPRGCSRGIKQKRAFIVQGLESGHFSTSYPFFIGGISAFNYSASSRCTIKEDILKQFEEQHKAEVERAERLTFRVTCHQSVELYLGRNLTRGEAITVTDSDPAALKVLFLDFHQVLDRSREGSAEVLQAIPQPNIDLIERTLQFCERDYVKKDPLIFVLSYVHSDWRRDHVVETVRRTEGLRGFISGVIICRQPTGAQGKASVIDNFQSALNLEGLRFFLAVDSADILEECAYWFPKEVLSCVHIKLRKQRSLADNCEYPSANFIQDEHFWDYLEAFLKVD